MEKAWSNMTRGNGLPLTGGRVGWDLGKKFFPVTLSREAMAALSLDVSKARLDVVWSNLV